MREAKAVEAGGCGPPVSGFESRRVPDPPEKWSTDPAASLNQHELEARLIYSAIVAGKSARFCEKVMSRFAAHWQKRTPLAFIRILVDEGNLEWVLRDIRAGNYTKLARCFRELSAARLNLRTCTPEQLEAVHGIGPKTSRFFILWTRPGEKFAALDVHVLRWLRKLGYDAPAATPSGTKYRELELAFLREAEKRGKTARELDAEIWAAGSGYKE